MDVFQEQSDTNFKNFQKFLENHYDKPELVQILNYFIDVFNEIAKYQPRSVSVNFTSITSELRIFINSSPAVVIDSQGVSVPNLNIDNIRNDYEFLPSALEIIEVIDFGSDDLTQKIEQKHSHEIIKYISRITDKPSFDITPFKLPDSNFEQKNQDTYITTGETTELEFKSSLIAPYDKSFQLVDVYTLDVNKGKNESQIKGYFNDLQNKIQYSFLKDLAGMLNGRGGVIRVGVADNGKILGLNPDLEIKFKEDSKEQAKDRYEVWVSGSLIPHNLSKNASGYILINYEHIDSELFFLEVKALPSREPIFLKSKDVENEIGDFYIRQGTSSFLLEDKYRDNYIENNFPNRIKERKINWTYETLKTHLIQSSEKNLSYFFEELNKFCEMKNLKINILNISEGVIEIKIPNSRQSISLFTINSNFHIIFEPINLRRSDYFKVDRNLREVISGLNKVFEDGMQSNSFDIANNIYLYLKVLEKNEKVDVFFNFLKNIIEKFETFNSRRQF